MRREFAVGVRLLPYLASKMTVLIVLTCVQVVLLMTLAFAIQPIGGADVTEYVSVGLILLACAWAAVTMGLAVSAVAQSVDQATSFVPLILIPQLLFAGAVVPYESMQGIARALSFLVVASWGFAAAGSAIGMNERLAGSPPDLKTFGTGFFDLGPATGFIAIGVFTGVGLVAAAVLLFRQRRR